jgi:hypothetical protein
MTDNKNRTARNFSLSNLSQKCANNIKNHPSWIAFVATAAIIITLFRNRELIPNYFSHQKYFNIAVRAMLTNAVGLLALLTFATDRLSNISKQTDNENFILGNNINSFMVLQSPQTRVISGRFFKWGVILIFLLPILVFEFPAYICWITPFWWGLFSVIASLLVWNLVSVLKIFGTNALYPENAISKIASHQLRRWIEFIDNAIKNKGGDPLYSYSMHSQYLKNANEAKPEDRNKYFDIINNLLYADYAFVVARKYTSDPEQQDKKVNELLGFIAGRQEALIEQLLATSDLSIQAKLLELICDTDSKYWNYTTPPNSVTQDLSRPICIEDAVPDVILTAIGIWQSKESGDEVDLIPAFVYHKISHEFSIGKITLTKNEVERVVRSINNVKHQRTKEYAVKQFAEALTMAAVIHETGDKLLPRNISEISSFKFLEVPDEKFINEDEKMWKNAVTSVGERALITEDKLRTEAKNALLQNTSKEFRVAYLFLILFQKPTFSISENKELLKCLSSIIAEDSSGSTDECFEGLDPETQEVFGDKKIDFERTRGIVSRFPKTPGGTFERVCSEDSLAWLFMILTQPITYDWYEEFESRGFGSLFEFSTVILWKEVASKDQCAGFDFAAEFLFGDFFNDSQIKPNPQKMGDAKMEVSKTASTLEQLGRTEDAKRLRRSIDLK